MKNTRIEKAKKEAESVINDLNNENFEVLKKFSNRYTLNFVTDLEKKMNGYMLDVLGDGFKISIRQGVCFGDDFNVGFETENMVQKLMLNDNASYSLWEIAKEAFDCGDLSRAIDKLKYRITLNS